MGEQGGYSGPQLFERTVALVKRYRKNLDDGIQRKPDPVSTPTQESKSPHEGSRNQVADQIEATVQRDQTRLNDPTEKAETDSKSQPLVRLPARHDPSSDNSDPNTTTTLAITHPGQLPQIQSNTPSQSSLLPLSPSPIWPDEAPKRKIIFASGGITNERQVQEVLAAGSSVALLYTALVYGGVGLVSSIKDGLEEELRKTGGEPGIERTI